MIDFNLEIVGRLRGDAWYEFELDEIRFSKLKQLPNINWWLMSTSRTLKRVMVVASDTPHLIKLLDKGD